MGLIFKVGEHHHFPQVPANFPKCGSWFPPDEDDEETEHDNGHFFYNSTQDRIPIVTMGLPYNVTNTQIKTGVPTSAVSNDVNHSMADGSGDSILTTDVPIALSDEDNFVVPQWLVNDSPIIQVKSGSHSFLFMKSSTMSLTMAIICIVVRFR